MLFDSPVAASLSDSSSPASSRAQVSNRERFANAAVQYDWVRNSRGQRLRTFVTRLKKGASDKVPVIFFVGWLGCDSMEYPNAAGNDGLGALMLRLIDESGYRYRAQQSPPPK